MRPDGRCADELKVWSCALPDQKPHELDVARFLGCAREIPDSQRQQSLPVARGDQTRKLLDSRKITILDEIRKTRHLSIAGLAGRRGVKLCAASC